MGMPVSSHCRRRSAASASTSGRRSLAHCTRLTDVVRSAAVADPASTDPNVQGARRVTELLAAEPRVTATAIQTVGSKGYDGFTLALVIG